MARDEVLDASPAKARCRLGRLSAASGASLTREGDVPTSRCEGKLRRRGDWQTRASSRQWQGGCHAVSRREGPGESRRSRGNECPTAAAARLGGSSRSSSSDGVRREDKKGRNGRRGVGRIRTALLLTADVDL